MKKYIEYCNKITEILNEIIETQAEKIDRAIDMLFEAFHSGHSIYVFGASHAGIFTEEMYGRAGGLMIVNPIFNPTLMLNTRPITVTSEMEQLEGFGRVILNGARLKKDDVLILCSVSGRNSVAIDMAIDAGKLGAKIICVTSLDYGRNVKSRHSSGKLLSELADIVIDNCGEYGDACIPVGEIGVKAGATSTVSGAAIANMLTVGFAQKCEESGIEPPVFESSNTDSGSENNTRRVMQYIKQIHYL